MVSLYHSLIGSIGYFVTTVCFDVSYGLSVFNRFLTKPNDELLNAPKRVIKYLVQINHQDLWITWKITPEDRKVGLVNVILGVVDTSFAMDPITRRNHDGFVTFNNDTEFRRRGVYCTLVRVRTDRGYVDI
jgi:hypothetical protein